MICAPRRSWRPLLVLVCVAGAVLAANNAWLFNLRLDSDATDWWSTVSSPEKDRADSAPAPGPANDGAPQLSIGRLANSSRFYPAGSWRIDSPDSSRPSSSFAWITADSNNAAATSSQTSSTPFVSFSAPVLRSSDGAFAPDGGPPPPPGFWISNASGNWGNASNWKDGIIANGATAQAHFDTLDITTNVTVTFDSSRIIGELDIGDTNGTHHYDIAPGSSGLKLIFDNSTATAILHQTSTSAGDTISVPLFLNNDLLVTNDSTAHPLQITGNITSNRASPAVSQITFVGTVNVSGDITPGANGGDLGLTISGNVNLSGTNTYGGTTFVTGSLFVKGDNSGADGFVQVSGGGSLLAGTGTVGGIVTIFGGTITGGDTTTVGKLTLTQSLGINSSEGGGGTYLANLDGATSDLLAITGTLNIGNGATLDIHGTADGTTTYVLATFLGGGLSGTFDFVNGLPSDYTLVYTSSDIELVPTAIPEPATWIGGALALGGLVFARQKRRR
jgi:hypothetical protein